MDKDSISIVVLSFDKYHELWKPFFDYFFKSWPKCPYPIYLLNNFRMYNDKRIINLLVGDDLTWSNSLYLGLNKIKSQRVIFFYDDTFIEKIDFKRLYKSIEFIKKNNIKSLTLRPNYFADFKNEFSLIPKNALYRTALFANIIEREYLITILNRAENAWEFEKIGNLRSTNENFYSTNVEIFKYKHGIIKGFWLRKTYRLLISQGYTSNILKKKFSFYQNVINQTKEVIFKSYLKYTPNSIIQKIEKYRNFNND